MLMHTLPRIRARYGIRAILMGKFTARAKMAEDAVPGRRCDEEAPREEAVRVLSRLVRDVRGESARAGSDY